MDLKAYLLSIPVPERHRLARDCGTSYAHLRNVAYGSKTCAESLAINIDRESRGRVRCEELRPDVDWGYLRGNLATPPAAVAPEADTENGFAPPQIPEDEVPGPIPGAAPADLEADHDYPLPVHDDRRSTDRRSSDDRRQRGDRRDAEGGA